MKKTAYSIWWVVWAIVVCLFLPTSRAAARYAKEQDKEFKEISNKTPLILTHSQDLYRIQDQQIAQHWSHYSHQSHQSHYSHQSHWSHYSSY